MNVRFEYYTDFYLRDDHLVIRCEYRNKILKIRKFIPLDRLGDKSMLDIIFDSAKHEIKNAIDTTFKG